MAYGKESEINEWEPRLKKRNVYGFAGKASGRGNITTIWNPYKHRIIMETHFRFSPDIHFYHFTDPVPFHCLYLYGNSIIDSKWKLFNIARTLLHLNPYLHYEEFASLMYELIHPSYPYTNHSEVRFSIEQYDKELKGIFEKREEPKPYRYKKFFFNPNVSWYEDEIIGIVKKIGSPLFGAEDGMDEVIREISKEKGYIRHQYLADMYSCNVSTIRKILRFNPPLRALVKQLNAEYLAQAKEEKKLLKKLSKPKKKKKATKKKVVRKKRIVKIKPKIPAIGAIVRQYWRENKKVIPIYVLRTEIRKREIKVLLKDVPYYHLIYTEQLKQTEKYKAYMTNVKGVEL